MKFIYIHFLGNKKTIINVSEVLCVNLQTQGDPESDTVVWVSISTRDDSFLICSNTVFPLSSFVNFLEDDLEKVFIIQEFKS